VSSSARSTRTRAPSREDLTRYAYCTAGTADEVCEIGGIGTSRYVTDCANGCIDDAYHSFPSIDAVDLGAICN
jgi:hypothetical protein